MKRKGTMLALCLVGTWGAFAQTSTTTSDTLRTSTTTVNTTTTTYPATAVDSSSQSSTTNSNRSSSMDNSQSGTSTNATTPAYNSSSSTDASTTTTTDNNDRRNRESRPKVDKPYKAFTGGFYVGANTTRYKGENIDGNNLNGRLGYQLGAFVRGGGRLYGQVGVEYFASSSQFFNPNDGQTLTDITGKIDTKWLQIPVLVGVKLAQSERGISAVRLAVGAEYANRLSTNNNVQINESEIKSGTFLGLANLGFDIGPVLIDIFYHHGFSDAVQGFNNSQRRSLGLNVGFKF